MPSPIHLRPMQESDAAEVAALVIHTIGTSNRAEYDDATLDNIRAYFTPEHMRRASRERDAYVAVWDDTIIGTAGTAPDREFEGAYRVLTFVVRPDCQGRGIGRRLQEAVEDVARNAGSDRLYVSSSLTARGFYAACGFEEIEERRDERHGSYVLMTKSLADEPAEETA